jgi:hypothetical protein
MANPREYNIIQEYTMCHSSCDPCSPYVYSRYGAGYAGLRGGLGYGGLGYGGLGYGGLGYGGLGYGGLGYAALGYGLGLGAGLGYDSIYSRYPYNRYY